MQPDDEQVFKLLEHLDHTPPDLRAADVMRAAETPRRAHWLRAATIAVGIGLAGAASYAIPGSPLRSWINPRSEPQPERVVVTESIDAGGVLVPANERLLVEFRSVAPQSMMQIRLTDGDNVAIRTADRSVTFVSDVNRVVVDNSVAPSADFSIEIPRNAVYVEVRVAGKRIFVKNGDRIEGKVTSPLS